MPSSNRFRSNRRYAHTASLRAWFAKNHDEADELTVGFYRLAAGYRRTLTCWVVSAKQETTRSTRLAKLIDASARGVRL